MYVGAYKCAQRKICETDASDVGTRQQVTNESGYTFTFDWLNMLIFMAMQWLISGPGIPDSERLLDIFLSSKQAIYTGHYGRIN